MRSHISEVDFRAYFQFRYGPDRELPQAAFKSLFAREKPRLDMLTIRLIFIRNFDRPWQGKTLTILGNEDKRMTFVSTGIAHGSPDADQWFNVMHVRPINVQCEDLLDVFLVSAED